MKAYSLIFKILLLLLAVSSCSDKEERGAGPEEEKTVLYSFRAVVEGSSKAAVASDGTVSWEAGDQIAVYDALSASFCTFTNTEGDGVFTFVGEPGTLYNFTHAYYPASVATASGSVTLPTAISLDDATNARIFPIMGVVKDNTLAMKHLGALLKYTIIGIPKEADALVLSSPEVSLSGVFDVTGDTPEIRASSGDGKVSIALEPGTAKSLVFYLPLPLGTYHLTCDVKSGESTLVSHTTLNAKEVNRAKYIRMRPDTPSFSGGSGTEQDPFLIASADDLKMLSYVSDDDLMRSSFYKQTADIDLAAESFAPIGSIDTPFTGRYDGDGHVISNLNVSTEGANAGLFGYIKGATVENISIQNATVVSGANYAGAIAGVLNGGNISACRVDSKSTISSTARGAGSIVGFVRTGKISECASHANVTAGTDVAGGIAGYLNTNAEAHDILVINCTFEPVYDIDGKISAATLQSSEVNAYMGGIAGSANASDGLGNIRIANCYAYPLEMRSSQIAGTTVNYIGGIVGRIVSSGVTVFNCITPVTYSNVIIGGQRLDAKTYTGYTSAACIAGTVSQDGSTIRRVFSKNTWPVCTHTGKSVTMSDVSIKTGDSNMRGFGGFAFSTSYDVSGTREYSQSDGGILAALNDGATAWNAENSAVPALAWAYDPTFGYPKPVGVDTPGVVTMKVSIIGDSISTYQGYIFSTDDKQMNKYYPDSENSYDNMVLNEQETWWWKLIYGKMKNARLEVANAFGGSTVTYTETKIDGMVKDPNNRTMENSLQRRYLDYGVGSPDILLYHGGRNDFGQFGGNTDVLLGAYDEASLQNAYDAPAGTLFNNYSAGTVAILKDFHSRFPQAKVLVIVHDQMSDGFDAAATAVTKFLSGKGLNIRMVTLHKKGTNNETNTEIGIYKEGGTHPNKVGCTNMTNYIYDKVGKWIENPYYIEDFELVDDSSAWE